MADWKRAGGGEKRGFGGGKKGGFGKPQFGAKRSGGFGRRDGEEREMFDAVCSNCGNDCQVPFKPNGKTPVLCKVCYAKSRDEEGGGRSFGGGRREPGAFEKKQFDTRTSFRGERSHAPFNESTADPRIGALEKSLVEVNQKLDQLIRLIGGTSLTSAVKKVSKGKKAAAPEEETF